jgi:hypothetical protein
MILKTGSLGPQWTAEKAIRVSDGWPAIPRWPASSP